MMKHVSKLTYLLGLPALIGLSLLYSMNVAVGNISISIPSSMNLHRPELWTLILGSTGTQTIVEVNTGKNVLNIRNGLIMGTGNGSLPGAKYVTIGGGIDNSIASVEKSGIGGGKSNYVDSPLSVIGGGAGNTVESSSKFSTVAGGYSNLVDNEGSVVGGEKNFVYGKSIVVGGSNNYVDGDGSMVFGTQSSGGARSFSWNSPVVKDYSAIIVATGGVLIGTYEPVTGVNLVVEGAVKLGTGLLTGNIGEIRMQSGCFYGYDGSAWHVINKGTGVGCPKISCTFGSVLLRPNQRVRAYTQSYSMDCSHIFKPVICNEDGTLGDGGQYYSYCYNLSGGIWHAEEEAECGTADGGMYVYSPTMSDGLCANGSLSGDIDTQNTLFAWQCGVGTSVVNCSATRVYSCNGEEPMGLGVLLGNTTQVYSTNLSSWTPVAQGLTPGACQWTCEDGYIQVGSECAVGKIVTFDSNRGTAVSSQTVASGGVAIQKEPEFPGYDFLGWYLTGSTIPFDFSTPITTDITLYAKWKYSFPFSDLDVYYLTDEGNTGHWVMMDKNLGASQVYTGIDNVDTYGFHYQWGNNYGFKQPIKKSSTQVDASGYGPGNYFIRGTFIVAPDISYGQPFDWSSVRNDNLWGGNGSETDRLGPCPVGYHLPTHSELSEMRDKWEKATNYSVVYGTIPQSAKAKQRSLDFLMPFAGRRRPEHSNLQEAGHYGRYRSSTSSGDETAYLLRFDPVTFSNKAVAIGYGLSVRCFKNSPTSLLTLHPNGGTGALIILHGGEITKLGTPTKGDETFGGWYKDSSFSPTLKMRTGDSVSAGTHLYAKWN